MLIQITFSKWHKCFYFGLKSALAISDVRNIKHASVLILVKKQNTRLLFPTERKMGHAMTSFLCEKQMNTAVDGSKKLSSN